MRIRLRSTILAAACALCCAWLAPQAAAIPDGINYQAVLTNADGSAVNTNVAITFAVYNVPTGGVPLWTQTETSVPVDQGLLTVRLANPANPFPAGLFNNPVYLGMFVAGEAMLPRQELTSAAFSYKAADSERLQGVQASTLDQNAEVSALQGGVAGLDSRVTAIEAIGGDITGVGAGPGLAGGGTSGFVNVSVAPGGINASMMAANSVGSGALINGSVGSLDLAPGAVGPGQLSANSVGTGAIINGAVNSADIAAGAVGPTQINASGNYTFGSVTITGATLIDSGNDIRIHDNINGFRWYDSAGTSQQLYIISSGSNNSMYDANQGRQIFQSNATGLGVGTPTTTAGYGVTVPSINVLGNAGVGLQRVTTNYVMSSTTAQCHSHGNLTCYYGTGSVACPVGTRVLGGGTNGSTGRYGSLASSYPSSTAAWFCGSTYDLADSTRTCYALCARLN